MEKLLTKCIVNVDNEFTFNGLLFKISKRNKDYRVSNSYKENDDYTNTAEMTYVLVGVNNDCKIIVLNENNSVIKDVTFVRNVGV